MTAYYVDLAAGSDAAAGTSTGAPWLTLQKAADTLVAGDIAYIQGTQTLTTAVNFTTNSGTTTSYIYFIGVNASWVNDGTKFTIDANSTAVNCINRNKNWIKVENAIFQNATSDGINSTAYWTFENCEFSNNGRYGIIHTGTNTFNQCIADGNSTFGIVGGTCVVNRCIIMNSGTGVFGAASAIVTNSLIYNMSGYGIQGVGYVVDSIIDDCLNGIFAATYGFYSNTRVTNCGSVGMYNTSGLESVVIDNCYFYNPLGADFTSGLGQRTNIRLTSDNSDDGYIDQATRDYRLTAGNDGVNVELPLGDLGETTQVGFFTQGVTPQPPTSTAPVFAGITDFEIVNNNKFKVSWSVGTGTITGYNIYIRNAASVFTSTYFVGCAPGTVTSTIIQLEPDNSTFLTGGTIYYCGVRAVNNGTEDVNVAELSNICSGSETIQRMTNTEFRI